MNGWSAPYSLLQELQESLVDDDVIDTVLVLKILMLEYTKNVFKLNDSFILIESSMMLSHMKTAVSKRMRMHSAGISLHSGKRFMQGNISGMSNILQPHHLNIVKDERVMFSKLLKNLIAIKADDEVLSLVTDTQSRIDDLFLVVIVGEFNSGKSTFVNSLLGLKLLREGILPTTDSIYMIRSGSTEAQGSAAWKQVASMTLEDVKEVIVPASSNNPWLDNIAIVDTPGTNAIYSKHETLTQNFVPRADLVLFVTSAERPLSDSETKFLKKIAQWGKKVVIVVNKCDIMTDQGDLERVLSYVSQNASKILETATTIPVFAVSARLGLQAKLSGNGTDKLLTDPKHNAEVLDTWNRSNLGPFETYLRSSLAQETLIKSKLHGPLLIADKITQQSMQELEQRERRLESDEMLLKMVEENMELYKTDMQKDILVYQMRIDKVFTDIIRKAALFFDDNITVLKLGLLMEPETFREKFRNEVLIDIKKPVDDIIHEVSDLIFKRSKAQAAYILSHLGDRPQKMYSINLQGEYSQSAVDHIAQEMLAKLRQNTNTTISSYSPDKTTETIVSNVKSALVRMGVVEAGSALTLGGLLSIQMLDLTGILAASTVALTGLVFVPLKKKAIKKEFETNMLKLKGSIDSIIADNISTDMERINSQILDSVSPYSRFVRMERTKVGQLQGEFSQVRTEIRNIQDRIGKLAGDK